MLIETVSKKCFQQSSCNNNHINNQRSAPTPNERIHPPTRQTTIKAIISSVCIVYCCWRKQQTTTTTTTVIHPRARPHHHQCSATRRSTSCGRGTHESASIIIAGLFEEKDAPAYGNHPRYRAGLSHSRERDARRHVLVDLGPDTRTPPRSPTCISSTHTQTSLTVRVGIPVPRIGPNGCGNAPSAHLTYFSVPLRPTTVWIEAESQRSFRYCERSVRLRQTFDQCATCFSCWWTLVVFVLAVRVVINRITIIFY